MTTNVELRSVIASLIGRLPRPPLRTALVKYVYLCDHYASREYGRQVTALTWRFHHYGPYAEAVMDEIAALDEAGVVSELWGERQDGTKYHIYGRGQHWIEPDLDPWVRGVIEGTVEEYGPMSLDQLLAAVYEMEPMASARRGDVLLLSTLQARRDQLRARAAERRQECDASAAVLDDKELWQDLEAIGRLQLRSLADRFLEDD